MTAKKQKDWLNDFVAQIESNLDTGAQRSIAIKQVTLTELTNQPYAG